MTVVEFSVAVREYLREHLPGVSPFFHTFDHPEHGLVYSVTVDARLLYGIDFTVGVVAATLPSDPDEARLAVHRSLRIVDEPSLEDRWKARAN
jgi:hypothetical protein